MKLNGLPNEVLSLIASLIPNPVDLFALSQTCCKLREIIGIGLYSFVTIRNAQDNERLARVLADHALLCKYVKTVHSKNWYAFGHESTEEEPHEFFLPSLIKLQNLHVSTGKEVVVLGRYFETAAEMGNLAFLRTCTLSFSDHKYDFFPAKFESFWKIMLLPGLEHLTVFSATMDRWGQPNSDNPGRDASNLQLIQSHRGTTALKRLHLWDSEIDTFTLGQLLQLPRQLEELVLHCNLQPSRVDRTPMNETTLMTALAPVTQSVKKLTFIQDSVEPLPWSRFPALEFLRVHPHPFFGVLDEPTDEGIRDALPPKLKELVLTCCRFSDGHWTNDDAWVFFADWLRSEAQSHHLEKVRLHPNDRRPVPDRIVEAFENSGVLLEIAQEYNQVRLEWLQDEWPVKPTWSWPLTSG